MALSGGPDSTALLHLTLDWARDRNRRLTALIVDHALRPESADEAAATAARAESAGVPAVVLRWSDAKPPRGMQAAAREARYGLMLDWCRTNGAEALLLGHHLDDQAATVLMRMQRGSGPDGLSAMRPVSRRDTVLLLRPLLGIPKHALLDWLAARDLNYVEDPSNDLDAFERNRLDRMLEAEDPDGGLRSRLGLLARRQARAAAALEHATDDAERRLLTMTDGAPVRIDLGGWLAEPGEIALRLLARAICHAGGRQPPLSALERAGESLRNRTAANLGGVLIECRGEALTVRPEPERRQT